MWSFHTQAAVFHAEPLLANWCILHTDPNANGRFARSDTYFGFEILQHAVSKHYLYCGWVSGAACDVGGYVAHPATTASIRLQLADPLNPES